MCLESTAYLDISEVATGELVLLADALGVLIELRDLDQYQTQLTREAISSLGQETLRFPRIVKPQIFVTFSGEADQDVVGAFSGVLDEFSDRLHVVPGTRSRARARL
jgi:hypothetical protein